MRFIATTLFVLVVVSVDAQNNYRSYLDSLWDESPVERPSPNRPPASAPEMKTESIPSSDSKSASFWRRPGALPDTVQDIIAPQGIVEKSTANSQEFRTRPGGINHGPTPESPITSPAVSQSVANSSTIIVAYSAKQLSELDKFFQKFWMKFQLVYGYTPRKKRRARFEKRVNRAFQSLTKKKKNLYDEAAKAVKNLLLARTRILRQYKTKIMREFDRWGSNELKANGMRMDWFQGLQAKEEGASSEFEAIVSRLLIDSQISSGVKTYEKHMKKAQNMFILETGAYLHGTESWLTDSLERAKKDYDEYPKEITKIQDQTRAALKKEAQKFQQLIVKLKRKAAKCVQRYQTCVQRAYIKLISGGQYKIST